MFAHCRIARVRYKSGGLVEVIPRSGADPDKGRMLHHARQIAETYRDGEMVGHVVMGWTGDGRYNLAYHNPDNCVIGRTLLPSWIGEAVRRSLIVDGHWH